jgi:hypothetical protein
MSLYIARFGIYDICSRYYNKFRVTNYLKLHTLSVRRRHLERRFHLTSCLQSIKIVQSPPLETLIRRVPTRNNWSLFKVYSKRRKYLTASWASAANAISKDGGIILNGKSVLPVKIIGSAKLLCSFIISKNAVIRT